MNGTIKELSVRLHGIEVGILRLIDGKMEFQYNSDAEIVVSLCMPLRKELYEEKICRIFFGGFLPENREILKQLSIKYKVSENNTFGLLKAIGKECAGAISFHDVNEEQIEEKFVKIQGEYVSDGDFKKHIENLPKVPYSGQKISLAGVQQKTAICLINNKVMFPKENIPTTHIVKPMIESKTIIESVENEYICMKSAKDIGLEVANVEIKNYEDIKVLLVERFDRIKSENNEYIIRIAQEDFCQALSKSDKYEVTFKDCLKILNQTSSPAINKQKFIKLIIFNYLIGNNDAQGKNFSIFKIRDDIKLTPAYDLLCTSVYDDYDFAMKIGKAKNRDKINKENWELFAKSFEISIKIIENELEKQKELLPKIVKKYADELKSEIGYKILDLVEINCKQEW